MANSERGTKRTDPETGKKFYDLNADPIVSPYTGKSYPRSYFEQLTPTPSRGRPANYDDDEETEEAEVENVAAESEEEGPEVISLEDADAEVAEGEDDIPDVEDVEDVEDIGDDEDVFLEEEDDEDGNLDFDVEGNSEER